MREDQYFCLPSQGNIYSSTRLGNILLTGSGNYGKVFAHINKTTLQELTLADITSNNIDVIALDAWDEPFPVLGITYVDTTNTTLEDEIKPAYLHVFSSSPSSKAQWSNSTSFSSREPNEAGDVDPKILTSESSSSPSSVPTWSFESGRSEINPKVKDKDDYIHKQLEIIGNLPSTVIKLNFIPYHLYHIMAHKSNGECCVLFLLSGSDKKIHTYEPNVDEKNDTCTFTEVPTRNYFPELPSKFDSIVTRIAVEFNTALRKRVSIIGCEDGTLRAYIVSDSSIPSWASLMEESLDSQSSTTELNSTSVTTSLHEDSANAIVNDKERMLKLVSSILSETNNDKQQDDGVIRIVNHYNGMITNIQFYTDDESNVNVVVSSSASPTYHYVDVLNENFKRGSCLKFSSKWDSVEAVCVADLDLDGNHEIVIGTFGCTLLVYKYMDEVKNWVIVAHRKFPNAIFSISFFDFYLHVVTAAGLHIIEYSSAGYFQKYGLVVGEKSVHQLTKEDNLAESVEKLSLSENYFEADPFQH